MADSFWYPSVKDVLTIHDDIVSEYPDTSAGIKNRGDVEFVLNFVEEGRFETGPETIHEKAFHLLRLLVANHPFVDANKRTALNTTVVFYALNGYRFEYTDELRSVLKQFGTDEANVDQTEVVGYLRAHTEEIDLIDEIEEWRDDLIRYGLDELTDDSSDPNDYSARHDSPRMATEDGGESGSPLDEVMEDIRIELVRRVAASDRDANRDVYDALERE